MRSARRRICRGDSSPEMYRVRKKPATCSASVDLPIPGSPPISMTDPGTTPPPHTRLNSPIPVLIRSTAPKATPDRGMTSAAGAEAASTGASASMMVFHSPQEGHFPCHFGESAPQAVHMKYFFCRAICHFAVLKKSLDGSCLSCLNRSFADIDASLRLL